MTSKTPSPLLHVHLYLGGAIASTLCAYVAAVKADPATWGSNGAADFYFLLAFCVLFGPTIQLHVCASRKLLSLPHEGGWRPLGMAAALVLALTNIFFSGYALQLACAPMDFAAWRYAAEHQPSPAGPPSPPSPGGNGSGTGNGSAPVVSAVADAAPETATECVTLD